MNRTNTNSFFSSPRPQPTYLKTSAQLRPSVTAGSRANRGTVSSTKGMSSPHSTKSSHDPRYRPLLHSPSRSQLCLPSNNLNRVSQIVNKQSFTDPLHPIVLKDHVLGKTINPGTGGSKITDQYFTRENGTGSSEPLREQTVSSSSLGPMISILPLASVGTQAVSTAANADALSKELPDRTVIPSFTQKLFAAPSGPAAQNARFLSPPRVTAQPPPLPPRGISSGSTTSLYKPLSPMSHSRADLGHPRATNQTPSNQDAKSVCDPSQRSGGNPPGLLYTQPNRVSGQAGNHYGVVIDLEDEMEVLKKENRDLKQRIMQLQEDQDMILDLNQLLVQKLYLLTGFTQDVFADLPITAGLPKLSS